MKDRTQPRLLQSYRSIEWPLTLGAKRRRNSLPRLSTITLRVFRSTTLQCKEPIRADMREAASQRPHSRCPATRPKTAPRGFFCKAYPNQGFRPSLLGDLPPTSFGKDCKSWAWKGGGLLGTRNRYPASARSSRPLRLANVLSSSTPVPHLNVSKPVSSVL